MTPFSLFKNDHRFHRENIDMHFIKDAGHFPSIEKPTEVVELMRGFIEGLSL